MPTKAHERRRMIFKLLTAFLVVSVVCAVLLAYAAWRRSSPRTLGDVVTITTEEDKEELQEFLRKQTGGIHDTVPDGEIGRILQRNVTKFFGGVSVTSNNAGMRADRDYGSKPANVYRVIVLGDSFAFGHEGLREDRYGEQLEDLLRRHASFGDGKTVEVLNIAQGSWTAVNELAYMISHFSAYRPDLVILLLVSNDLDDTQGVRGIGTTTGSFSPEYRDKGSAFYSVYHPSRLGHQSHSLLYADLGPESSRRWMKAFSRIKRLETTLDAVGGRLLVSAFDEYRATGLSYAMSLWRDLIIQYHRRVELHSPLLFVHPYLEKDTVVGVHPNRKGHGFLATHYLHVLKDLGWIDVGGVQELPPVHEDMDMRTTHAVDSRRVDEARTLWRRRYLGATIDFTDIDKAAAVSIYGGLVKRGERFIASRKLMFLLERERAGGYLEIRVDVPGRPELFPFELDLLVNGFPLSQLTIASHRDSGERLLRAPLPPELPDAAVLEIELFTRCYWAEIVSPTMLSYFPLSARVVD